MDIKYLFKLSRLLKLVVEMPTDRGLLVAQGEEILPGTDVFVQDENGDLVAPENGNYVATTPEGDLNIVIEAGKVLSMEHVGTEVPPTQTAEQMNQEGSDNGSDKGSDNGEGNKEENNEGSDNGEGNKEENNEGSQDGTGDDNGSKDGTDTSAKMEDQTQIDALKAEIEAKDARIAELEEKLAELQKKIDEVEPSAEEAEKFSQQKPSDDRMEKMQRAIEAVKMLKK